MDEWLKGQWEGSLAHIIWDDLTPLGRVIFWIPCWAACWVAVPVIVVIGFPLYLLSKAWDKLGITIPPIFFK